MPEMPEPQPQDEHNALLLAHTRPSDWKNPEPASRYNLVVIGAGTAGLVTAAAAATLGARVALVEHHLLGGDCLNVGCVPSKTLIRSSRAAADLRQGNRFGLTQPQQGEWEFSRVMERVRRVRAGISRHDSAQRFRELGVDVFLGHARFRGPDSISVDGAILPFKRAVIATGARPAIPPVAGLLEAGYLTNETVFNLTECPKRLLLIGGGPLGCELAQAFARLGSQVTIVEMLSQFLPNEDPDAAAILQRALQQDGIRLRLNTLVKSVATSGGEKQVTLQSEGEEEKLAVDEILVGAGRIPNIEDLNLQAAGVEHDPGKGVVVNDYLQTTNPRIYAAGDVCLAHKFTHTADAAARIVVRNALFLGRRKVSSLTIPWCTYTDPEIAHVGIYEKDARQRGIPIQTFTISMKDVDRAVLDGEEEGFTRIHIQKGSDTILGATIVARHAGEMISELSLAVTAGIGLGTIAEVIHPYPTQAEAIRKAADAYNRARLTRFVKKLLRHWLAWTR